MQFVIHRTFGGEVIVADHSAKDRPVYYEAPVETGLWRVDLNKIEAVLSIALDGISFGTSIETYHFGFELADLNGWAGWFDKTRGYASYRPKSKSLVSIGQLDWLEIKDMSIDGQFAGFRRALKYSLDQLDVMKRKPKDFRYAEFGTHVEKTLDHFAPVDFAAIAQ